MRETIEIGSYQDRTYSRIILIKLPVKMPKPNPQLEP